MINTYIETITFTSTVSGPKVLVFGSMHGSEPCGHLAITKFIQEIKSGKQKIQSGSVTFIPTCNPVAFKKT